MKKFTYAFILVSLFTSIASNAAPESFFEKALLSFQQEDYQTSIIHLKNHLQKQPGHLSSRVLLAENHLALSDGLSAETELKIAHKSGAGDAKISRLLARAYLLQKQYDRILEILIPRHNDIHYQSAIFAYRGLAYLGKKQLSLAETAFKKSLDLVPINIDAILGLAKTALKKQEHHKAITLIEKAKKIAPQNKHALLMAAITYKLLQKLDNALINVNQLLSLEPDNYSGLLIRASLYTDLNQHAKALQDVEKITTALPNEPISNYIKMQSLNATDESNDAETARLHLTSIIGEIPKEMMNEEPIYYFLSGVVNFQSSAFEAAEKSFLKYYNVHPSDLNVIKLLARTQMALGQHTQAKKYLMKGHLLDQNEQEIWILLGRVSMLLGNLSKAEYYFEKVSKKQPESLTAQTELARLLLFSGKYFKLINLFANAINSPDALNTLSNETLFMLAKAYQETNNVKSALNITEYIIKKEPTNSYAYQLHGSLSGLMGNIDQAYKDYLKSVALDANNFQVVIHLSRLELAQGKAQQAISRLKKQLEKSNNSALFIELGNALTKMGDNKNATIYYRKALSHNPGSILSLTKIVEKHTANNEIAEAILAVEEYLRKYDDIPDAHHLAADLYFKNSQHTKALAELERAVKLSNQKGQNLLKLAQMQLQLTQRQNAINSLQRAIGWQKEYLPAYLLLIAIYTEDKNQEKSRDYINRISSFNTDQSLLLRLEGELLWAIGNDVKAEKLFKKSIDIQPTKPAVLGLYRVYRKNKQLKDIETLLQTWLLNNSNDLTSAISLAENYRQQGDLQSASHYYDHLLKLNPNNLLLLNNAAIIEQRSKNYDAAAKLADMAYQIDNKNANILDTKAWIEVQRENLEPALALLREANTLDYQNAEIKYHLAITLDKIGRRNEGLPYLESAVNSHQDFSEKVLATELLKRWQTQ